MLKEVIYISSDERSGSTMLDLMLGNHSKITSLGEVHHLHAYATENRDIYNPVHPLVCMCGRKILECDFWIKVEKKLGIPIKDLRMRLLYSPKKYYKNIECNEYNLLTFFKLKFMRKCNFFFPELFNIKKIQKITGYRKIANNYFKLYHAAAEVANTPYVVDSSKSPHRFKLLYLCYPEKMKIIILSRDPKGVVFSKMKRGMDLVIATKSWVKAQNKIERFSKNIDKKKIIKVKYEDICNETVREMIRICDFLGIDYEPSMTVMNKEGRHHIGGSPSKFNQKKMAIKMDDEYIERFSKSEIEKINIILEKAQKKCGFS